VNERTGEEAESTNIEKGFDLGGGEYVMLSDEEVAAAEPERSRQIEITDFVNLDEIDPIYYPTTYYLAPEGDGSDKPYALLRKALRESRKVDIATMVMRNKEYLVAIRPEGDVLALETMFFADEVRSPHQELPRIPDDNNLGERKIAMANLLIESMGTEWDPQRFHDTRRQKVEALIEQKGQGQSIVMAKGAPAPKWLTFWRPCKPASRAMQIVPSLPRGNPNQRVRATKARAKLASSGAKVTKKPALSKTVRRKAS
jgi:DNA end-binding protein Ku